MNRIVRGLVGLAFWLLGILVVISFLAGMLAQRAWAHDQYREWRQPGNPNASCCNEKVDHGNGHITGDCQPVTATPIGNGAWLVTVEGREVIVTPDKVLPFPSPDGRTHWCGVGVVTYCFVPAEVRI